MQNKKIVISSIVVVFIFFFILISYTYGLFGLYFKGEFKSKEWLNNPNLRITMIDDLIDSRFLIEQNKEYTKALLGNDCKHCNVESNDWMYYIEKNGRGSDFIIIDIEFSENKVISVSKRK